MHSIAFMIDNNNSTGYKTVTIMSHRSYQVFDMDGSYRS